MTSCTNKLISEIKIFLEVEIVSAMYLLIDTLLKCKLQALRTIYLRYI
jgi:hypothetical protein